MDEWSAWETFFTTGSIFDYMKFKSLDDARDSGADTINREETDEIPNRGTDYKGTEYR